MRIYDSIYRNARRAVFARSRFFYMLAEFYWWLFRPKTSGVKVFVKFGDEVLLVRQSYGSERWTLPGGGQKAGETIEKAARREVQEEVGLMLKEIAVLGSFLYTGEYKRDYIWVAEGEAESRNAVIDGEEIVEARWFSPDEFPEVSSPLMNKFLELRNR